MSLDKKRAFLDALERMELHRAMEENLKDLLREFSYRVKVSGMAHGAVRVATPTSPEEGYLLEIKLTRLQKLP